MLCECRYDQEQDEPWMACGSKSGCINRQLNIECPENQCPTGAFCLNQRFQLKQYASVEVFKTDKKGLGLRARSKITKNSFVMEYCGEVIPLQMLKKRAIEYAKNRAKHFYFMSLKPNEYIDASKRGNISRFMNHSCNPNCALQKWVVGAQVRVGMFAIKDIEKGEELTFDYKFERYGQEAQPCYCGEDNCKGFIGGDSKSELYDDDDFTDDEAEDPQVAPRSPVQKVVVGLENTEQVKKMVQTLMFSATSATKVLKQLSIIIKTDSVQMLRKFIGCHGLDVLKTCLDAHIQQKTIVRHQILQVLKSLPISSKNGVLKLEEIIQTMTDTTVFGDYTAQLASELLESWKDLQMVYKIPKKSVDMIKSESLDSRPEKKQKVDEPLDWKAQLTPSIYQVAMNRSSKYQGANNIFSGDKSDSGDKVGRRDSIGSFSRQESNSSFQRQESSGSFQKQDSNGWSKESSSGRTKESSSGWKKEPSSGWGKQDSNPRDRRNAPAWEKRDNREKRDKIPENKLDQNEKPLEKKPSPILKPNWIQCKEEQAVYYRNMVTLERTTIPPIQSPPRPAIINGISEDDMRKMIQMADQAVKQHREKEKEPKEQPKDSDQVQLVKQQIRQVVVKQMSKYKDNLREEKFKELAKAVHDLIIAHRHSFGETAAQESSAESVG